MEKKSVSATILVLFLALFFTVVGSCFAVFVYKDTRTVVKDINLVADASIEIFSNEKLTKKVKKLKLSDMELGLKPATGKIDAETQVPTTIDDKGTSEGYYSTIYVKTSGNFRVILSNIKIKSDHDELLIEAEKKNIFVGVKDVKNSVKTLEDNGVEVCRFSNVSAPIKMTFLIWLGSLASDELEGAEISFDIKFVAI